MRTLDKFTELHYTTIRSFSFSNSFQLNEFVFIWILLLLTLTNISVSLSTYLKRNRGCTSATEKRRLVCETAAGLAYLAESGCIHRDIAARNCMLNDVLVVKISGFSLCEPIREMHDSSNRAIAVKWQAPEVLKNRDYSLKSDVWSFGVLMWEVYSEGSEPYGELTPNAVKEMVLRNNYRMIIPEVRENTNIAKH
uniref:Protein kinase domain-containing protein n=1 Tax=Angiostrongylus cantonensis TaxID=6313 RepID=A0A0K0DF19_ANGCA